MASCKPHRAGCRPSPPTSRPPREHYPRPRAPRIPPIVPDPRRPSTGRLLPPRHRTCVEFEGGAVDGIGHFAGGSLIFFTSRSRFEGGSSGQNKKPRQTRRRYLHQIEEGRYVDETVASQRAADASREEGEERQRKAAIRKGKGKQVKVNVRKLDSVDYAVMRKRNCYEQPRDTHLSNNHFWNAEQLSIFEDIYSTMKMHPMRPLDMTFLKKKSDFSKAMSVTQKFGLHHLMVTKCNYNEYYVKQFFSTLVFKNDEAITMMWMTDNFKVETNFSEFADILGYTFEGANSPVGHRVHGPNKPNKDVLQDLYEPGFPVGKVAGLRPLYAQLVLLLCDNIAPSGGNNDVVRSSLVNLLHYASRAAADKRVGHHFNIDVMDFIFNEMNEAMLSANSIPYAPHIMMLLRKVVGEEYFDEADCTEHKIKRPYVKQRTTSAAPSGDTFMADARASGAMPRGSSIGSEIKKLNWFQRNVLCMNVEIRKSQYKAHLEQQQLIHNQALIIHRLKRSEAPPPKKKTPLPYKSWAGSSVDWVEMEKQLGIHSSSFSAHVAQEEDVEDSEAEYESGDDDDDDDGGEGSDKDDDEEYSDK